MLDLDSNWNTHITAEVSNRLRRFRTCKLLRASEKTVQVLDSSSQRVLAKLGSIHSRLYPGASCSLSRLY